MVKLTLLIIRCLRLNKKVRSDDDNLDWTKVHGMKYQPRDQEPSMFQIMTWGLDDARASDYTGKKRTLKNQIRKTDS